MNINDALNIFNLKGKVSKKELKKAYLSLSLKYHPDRNPAAAHTMKLINVAYQYLQELKEEVIQPESDFKANNYSEKFHNVLRQLFELQNDKNSNITIEICSQWIWITGKTKPHAKKLGRKEGIGCYFSRKDGGCWYYRPEEYKSKSRKSHSMEEIRTRHGSAMPFKNKLLS